MEQESVSVAQCVVQCPGCSRPLVSGTYAIGKDGITVYQCMICDQVDELFADLIATYHKRNAAFLRCCRCTRVIDEGYVSPSPMLCRLCYAIERMPS